MSHRATIGRKTLLWGARAVCVFVVAGVLGIATVYLSAKLYQFRVESLYSKVVPLRVGVSTFADAHRLANEYKNNLVLETKECTSVDCRFVIRLTNFPYPVFDDDPLFWRIGVRPAMAATTVSVTNGTVSFVHFGVSYRTEDGYWLDGSFNAARELTMYDRCSRSELGRNSQYMEEGGHITNGAGGGQLVRVAFGQGASDEQRARATNIRLGCITAIPGCKTSTDLMPGARKEQQPKNNTDESFNLECTQYFRDQKQKQGEFPWQLESAFYPTPISVGGSFGHPGR